MMKFYNTHSKKQKNKNKKQRIASKQEGRERERGTGTTGTETPPTADLYKKKENVVNKEKAAEVF